MLAKSIERLSESHGNSIFQLRTSHFNDVFKRFGFALERIDQLLKMFHKFEVSIIHTYMYGGRISVIGGLRAIDGSFGEQYWYSPFMSHDFKRAIGYYLIGIILVVVPAPLNHVYRELLVVLAFEYSLQALG